MTALTNDLITRLRRTVSSIDLDGQSRATLEHAFDRFAALEQRREVRAAIASARAKRDQIARFLPLLVELDELNEREQDRSVFAETAVLFEEIARCAAEGAMMSSLIAALLTERCTSVTAGDESCVVGAADPDCRECRLRK